MGTCAGGVRFSNSNRIIHSDYRILLLLKMHIPNTNPCELGTHLFSLFDKASLQQILGTLGVDEAVSGVQGLGLIHPASSFTDVTCMLSREQDMENKITGSCSI